MKLRYLTNNKTVFTTLNKAEAFSQIFFKFLNRTHTAQKTSKIYLKITVNAELEISVVIARK